MREQAADDDHRLALQACTDEQGEHAVSREQRLEHSYSRLTASARRLCGPSVRTTG